MGPLPNYTKLTFDTARTKLVWQRDPLAIQCYVDCFIWKLSGWSKFDMCSMWWTCLMCIVFRMHHWPSWPSSFLHINTLEDSDNCNHSSHCNHGNRNYGNSCHNSNCNQARAKLNCGSSHSVIVYVPRDCTKKDLERTPQLSSFWDTSYFFGHFEPL